MVGGRDRGRGEPSPYNRAARSNKLESLGR